MLRFDAEMMIKSQESRSRNLDCEKYCKKSRNSDRLFNKN